MLLTFGSKLKRQGAALLLAAGTASASATPEAIRLLEERRVDEARVSLEQASAQGDKAAQGFLALFHMRGYDGKPDEPKACRLAIPAAEAADPNGRAVLAICHLKGIEVARDHAKALELSRASAQAGSNEGRFAHYLVVLQDPARSYFVDGKPDPKRYFELAARPIEARMEEVAALDMLALAAASGHVHARASLAAYLSDSLGEQNRARAEALFATLPQVPPNLQPFRAALKQAVVVARESYATLRLLRDAQMAAYASLSGRVPKECRDIRFKEARMAGALRDAVYLPHSHPLVQRSYLVQGSWDEDWTFVACGTEATARIVFRADGLSGAHFTAQRSSAPGK